MTVKNTFNRRFGALMGVGLFAGTMAGGLLPAGEASARDEHSSGALNCVTSGGSRGTWNAGYITNQSTTSNMSVRCPISRDNSSTTTGTRKIHGIDANPNAAISCSAYEVNHYGTTWSWSGWIDSVGSGPNNYRTFSWPSITSRDGSAHFYCIVPPRHSSQGASRISSYSVG